MGDRDPVRFRITADDSEAQGAFRRVSQSLKNLNTDTQGLLKNMQSHWLGVSAAIAGAAVAAGQAWDIMARAAKFNEQMDSLNRLAAHYGTTSNKIVESIREAAEGLISMSEAADIAARGLQKGLGPQQIVELARAAELFSNFGGEANEILGQFVEGITNARQRSIVTAAGVVELAEGTNEAGRAMALYNAVLEKANELQKVYGETTDSLSDKMDRLKVSVQDLQLQMGQYLIKAAFGVGAAFTAAAAGLTYFIGGIAGIGAAVGKLLDWAGITENMEFEFRNLKQASNDTVKELLKLSGDYYDAMVSSSEQKVGKALGTINTLADRAADKVKETTEKVDQDLEQYIKNLLAAEERQRREEEALWREFVAEAEDRRRIMREGADAWYQFEYEMTQVTGTETDKRLLEIERWEQNMLVIAARAAKSWEDFENKKTQVTQAAENQRAALTHPQEWQGPMQPSTWVSPYGTPLLTGITDLLGNAVSGLTSGFAPQSFLTKILGGQMTGSNWGGMLGGFLGGTFGGSALGSFIGSIAPAALWSALGPAASTAIFGSIIPGIGTILGALIGTFAGSLFEGEPDNPRMRFRYRPGEAQMFHLQENNMTLTSVQEAQWNLIMETFHDNLLEFAETVGIDTTQFFQEITSKWKEFESESDAEEWIDQWFGKLASAWTGIDFSQYQRDGEKLVDTITSIIGAVKSLVSEGVDVKDYYDDFVVGGRTMRQSLDELSRQMTDSAGKLSSLSGKELRDAIEGLAAQRVVYMEAAKEYIAWIKTFGETVQKTLSDLRESMERDFRTPAENLDHDIRRLATSFDALSAATDPQKIEQLSQEFTSWFQAVYQGLAALRGQTIGLGQRAATTLEQWGYGQMTPEQQAAYVNQQVQAAWQSYQGLREQIGMMAPGDPARNAAIQQLVDLGNRILDLGGLGMSIQGVDQAAALEWFRPILNEISADMDKYTVDIEDAMKGMMNSLDAVNKTIQDELLAALQSLQVSITTLDSTIGGIDWAALIKGSQQQPASAKSGASAEAVQVNVVLQGDASSVINAAAVQGTNATLRLIRRDPRVIRRYAS